MINFQADYLCIAKLTKSIVRYVPEWLPGAGFKKIARGMRQDLERLYDVPFDFVKFEMVRGIRNACLLSDHRFYVYRQQANTLLRSRQDTLRRSKIYPLVKCSLLKRQQHRCTQVSNALCRLRYTHTYAAVHRRGRHGTF